MKNKNKLLILSMILMSFFSTITFSQTTYKILFNKNKINLPLKSQVSCKLSNISNLTLISSQDVYYSGNGYDGSIQNISIPSGTKCVEAIVKGGGGGYFLGSAGGSGDLIDGIFNLLDFKNISILSIIVSGHTGTASNDAGGGGLSGVFTSSVPSKNSAIIVSGGGGGGGAHQSGYNGSLNPSQPLTSGGQGINGAGGESSTGNTCQLVVSFLKGSYCQSDIYGSFGGGSRASGYIGGGGGIPGGNLGSSGCNSYCPGGGGTSYVSNYVDYKETVGGGGAGSTVSGISGHVGDVYLNFYQ